MTEGLEVIGAGFGRTGTLSLKAALERLGFGPCYHMIETFSRPEHATVWLDAAGGGSVDWRRLMSEFRATVDWPACAFYAPLMEAFPHARVALSVRDPEGWYGSISESIGQRPSAQLDQPVEDLQTRMVRRVVWEGSMRGKNETRTRQSRFSKITFIRYSAQCRRIVFWFSTSRKDGGRYAASSRSRSPRSRSRT
jgi:Sulfotransferase domain